MANKNGNDELMELLDSFDMDDEYNELSSKMEVFTNEKRKREEKNRKIEEPVEDVIVNQGPVSISNTIVAPLKSTDSSDAGGKTLVFSNNTVPSPNAGGETVVIGENQIHEFVEEEGDPEEILRRQVIQEFKDQPMITDTVKRILFIVAGVCVAFALLLGGYKVIAGFMHSDTTETDAIQEKYFNELKSWAQNYNNLSDEEKKEIQNLEAKFNRLSDEQKEEINAILMEKTGMTFDELLAKSKSNEEEKKNNNTELAEKKAEIKAQMDELKPALDEADSALKDAKATLDQAEVDYNEAQQFFDTAQSEAEAALEALNEIENDALLPAEEFKEKYESNEDWRAARNQAKENYSQKLQDISSLQINLNNAYYAYNVATAQYNEARSNYDYYAGQYRDLENQLNALDRE
ncbi:MAG: hypothetical protein KBT48_08035 [Firmicutes bacterium]|nr:hypothetical protein [Bacillota bacterium]